MIRRAIIEVPIIGLFLGYAIVYFVVNALVFGLVLLGICLLVGIEFTIVYFKILMGNWVSTADYSLCQTEQIHLKVEDKVTLEGALYTPFRTREDEETPLPVMIFIHGLGATHESFPWLVIPLVKIGYAVLSYDQRGHGKSGGRRSEAVKMVQDVKKVVDYVQRRVDLDISRCGVYGDSLGGIMALTGGYNDPRVACVIALSALHDVKAFCEEKKSFSRRIVYLVLRFLGLKTKWTDEENQMVSPRYFLQPNPENKDRVFLIHAKDDFIDYKTQFLANAVAAELPKENTLLFQRGWHSLSGQETVAVAQVLQWVEKTIGKP